MSAIMRMYARVNGVEHGVELEVSEDVMESDCNELAEELYWSLVPKGDGYRWAEVLPDGQLMGP